MRIKIIFATGLNGLATLAPQMIALFTLESAGFGKFSVAYLAYAFFVSMLMSILCDTWIISDSQSDPATYSKVLTSLSLIAGILSFVIVSLALDFNLGAITSLCVFFGIYRSGVRYLLVYRRKWKLAIISDSFMLIGTIAGFLGALLIRGNGLITVMFAWGIGALLGSLVGGAPQFGPRKALTWAREHKRVMAPLISDSLVMDIASIGTPYALLPFLGPSGFGMYRAISNLGSPLRLLLSPLRPLIISSPTRSLGPKLTTAVMSASVLAGILFSSGFYLLSSADVSIGVLSEISEMWLPAGIYSCATILLVFYSLVCRALQMPRLLFVGRLIYTALGLSGPLIGFWFWGVEGAIWLFSVVSLVSGFMWAFLAFLGGQTKRNQDSQNRR